MSEGATRSGAVLAGLFSSRVRLIVLHRLVATPGARSHARELAKLSGEHFNAVWQELKHLESLGVLRSQKVGNQVQYEPDPAMPLLSELRSLLATSVENPVLVPTLPPAEPSKRPAAALTNRPPQNLGLVMGETD